MEIESPSRAISDGTSTKSPSLLSHPTFPDRPIKNHHLYSGSPPFLTGDVCGVLRVVLRFHVFPDLDYGTRWLR